MLGCERVHVFSRTVFKEAGVRVCICNLISHWMKTVKYRWKTPIGLGTGWFQLAAKEMRPVCFLLLYKH